MTTCSTRTLEHGVSITNEDLVAAHVPARVKGPRPALASSEVAFTLTSPSHLVRRLSPSYHTVLYAPTLPPRFALPAYERRERLNCIINVTFAAPPLQPALPTIQALTL